MYSLFTSKSVLESILKLGGNCKWYSALQRTDISKIYISEDFIPNIDDSMGPQDELSAINQYIQITPKSKHFEYCKKSKEKNNSEFIEYIEKPTNALFLVDSELEDVDLAYIGKGMGIYCHCFSETDEKLFDPTKSYPLKKDEKDFSWDDFFTTLRKLPTKSAIICDRNIFSNDCLVGCKNIQSILNNLIVSGRHTEYSFIILFEKFSDDHQEQVNERKKNNILNVLKEYLKNRALHGGLPVINTKIDLVSVSTANRYHYITHDRSIYCDYFTVGATHALSALDDNGYSLKTQIICHSALFSSVGKNKSDIIQQRQNVFPDYRKIFEENMGLQCYRITAENVSEIPASDCLNDCRLLVDATS